MGEQAGETLDAESGIQNVDMNRLYAMTPDAGTAAAGAD